MNINPKIFTANEEELASYSLFHDMIKVMKASDGVEPAGACCGRNTKQIVSSFLNNKQKYFDFMKNINERLIKPLKKGVVYISPMKKMLNYELMTDNEILISVKKGYLSDKIFDWTEYNNAQKPITAETPAGTPAQKPVEEEILVVESLAESPAEEETPVVDPIDGNAQKTVEKETPEETPVVKTPKRSSKRGSK